MNYHYKLEKYVKKYLELKKLIDITLIKKNDIVGGAKILKNDIDPIIIRSEVFKKFHKEIDNHFEIHESEQNMIIPNFNVLSIEECIHKLEIVRYWASLFIPFDLLKYIFDNLELVKEAIKTHDEHL